MKKNKIIEWGRKHNEDLFKHILFLVRRELTNF